jgi:hypothetical protein
MHLVANVQAGDVGHASGPNLNEPATAEALQFTHATQRLSD